MIMGAWGLGRKRGWTNPYVTDGLVAMWDGEWNAGGGVHDPAAAAWKDVVSGIIASSNSPFAVGDNFLQRTGSQIMSATLPVTIPANGNMAFEVVMQSNGRGNNGCATIGHGLLVTVKSDGVVYYGYSDTQTQQVFNNTNVTNRNTYTLNREGNTGIAAYFNGEYKKLSVNGMGDTSDANTISLGGGRSAAYPMNYYCFRIYNRLLTADEIAANYAIDKERFNLP